MPGAGRGFIGHGRAPSAKHSGSQFILRDQNGRRRVDVVDTAAAIEHVVVRRRTDKPEFVDERLVQE